MTSDIMIILNELNKENGSNYKLSILKKHKDNLLLQKVLQMTHDNVKYTYGLSAKHWQSGSMQEKAFSKDAPVKYTIEQALEFMETKLATREITGNAAIDGMHEFLTGLPLDDKVVVYRVLNRDLRLNMGRTLINKVIPNLIQKPLYMRCDVYSAKTAKKINPDGAIFQLKADGTYREATVENGAVKWNSRSGEEYFYPVLSSILKDYPDGHYFGELTVEIDGVVQDRSTGNGLINSLEPPHENIVFDTWDYVTLEEYTKASKKEKCSIKYVDRLNKLKEILSVPVKNVRLIETHTVKSIKEALVLCNKWMNAGKEGGILKDKDSVFRDGTNPQQLKLKLAFSVDVRITGFKEGTIGSKREKTFGAIEYSTDDKMISGFVSGFSDLELEEMNSNRSLYLGKIIEIEGNDLTIARGSDTYAVSHPRFICVRNDKNETDDLQRAQNSINLSKLLSQ